VIGGLLLACEAIMVMGYVGAVISERTTGSWALLGTAIAAGIFHLPLALLGVLFGVVLLVEPGGGRVSIGLPLFGFSLAMLFVDNVFVRFGTAIADWLGY
jgi:hypothetical protein